MVAIMELDIVSKYFGAVEVLRAVSLSVNEKDVVSVIGPSGSGKTTLLRCLAMLEAPSAGRIVMDGRTIGQAKPDATIRNHAARVRPEIGMVFQHFNLWPHMTVMENVIEAPRRGRELPLHEAVAIGEVLLAKVGLLDKRAAYPGKLSGGQQQRVAIAR